MAARPGGRRRRWSCAACVRRKGRSGARCCIATASACCSSSRRASSAAWCAAVAAPLRPMLLRLTDIADDGGARCRGRGRCCRCCRQASNKHVWRPGGDVLLASTTDGVQWTKARRILVQVRHARRSRAGAGAGACAKQSKLASKQAHARRCRRPRGGRRPRLTHPTASSRVQDNSTMVPWVTANPPAVAAGSGALVLPVWGEVPQKTTCAVDMAQQAALALVSADDGATWERSTPVRAATRTWLIEGTIVPLPDAKKGGARLLQFYRTATGCLFAARSEDGGRTWSQPRATSLPNPNSKVHALVLSNGAIAIAYNHHLSRANIDGVRSLLYVALSTDEGERWKVLARLETNTTKGHRYHYPTMLQVGVWSAVHHLAPARAARPDEAPTPRCLVRLRRWAANCTWSTRSPSATSPGTGPRASRRASRWLLCSSNQPEGPPRRATACGGTAGGCMEDAQCDATADPAEARLRAAHSLRAVRCREPALLSAHNARTTDAGVMSRPLRVGRPRARL
eukprot:scaffold1960_cov332-Prasinococcus_capsulatus_cf.AAC.3